MKKNLPDGFSLWFSENSVVNLKCFEPPFDRGLKKYPKGSMIAAAAKSREARF